jgi:hypothetical protein
MIKYELHPDLLETLLPLNGFLKSILNSAGKSSFTNSRSYTRKQLQWNSFFSALMWLMKAGTTIKFLLSVTHSADEDRNIDKIPSFRHLFG